MRATGSCAASRPFYGHLGWGEEEAALLAEAIAFVGEHCDMVDGSVELTLSGNKFPPDSRKLLAAAADEVGGRRGGKLFVTGLTVQSPLRARVGTAVSDARS